MQCAKICASSNPWNRHLMRNPLKCRKSCKICKTFGWTPAANPCEKTQNKHSRLGAKHQFLIANAKPLNCLSESPWLWNSLFKRLSVSPQQLVPLPPRENEAWVTWRLTAGNLLELSRLVLNPPEIHGSLLRRTVVFGLFFWKFLFADKRDEIMTQWVIQKRNFHQIGIIFLCQKKQPKLLSTQQQLPFNAQNDLGQDLVSEIDLPSVRSTTAQVPSRPDSFEGLTALKETCYPQEPQGKTHGFLWMRKSISN